LKAFEISAPIGKFCTPDVEKNISGNVDKFKNNNNRQLSRKAQP
jgi:hypothetical protein